MMLKTRGSLGLLLVILACPSCRTFYVAYRIESNLPGVNVYSDEGKHLGKTPVTVVEYGTSRSLTSQPSDCLEGDRTFVFRPRCHESEDITRTVRLPRTCRGQDSVRIARSKPYQRFVFELPTGFAGPCGPVAPHSGAHVQGPLIPVELPPPPVVKPAWMPVDPESLPDPVPLPEHGGMGQTMALAGLGGLIAAWAIPAIYELWAVSSPHVKGNGGRTAIPVIGPILHGVDKCNDVRRCRQTDWALFCELDYIPAVFLFADAAVQLVGLGFITAGAALSSERSPPSEAEGLSPMTGRTPSLGLSWTWRF